uniref:Isocitrate dehydrogenase [NAD] subunit, mitochondrial n=1 Tax=Schistosoma japonicum TaxID=6182 RepID=C1LL11_SCHJA|nr:isocitrate dehydrogenase (NAD+) [Schistosoma japonicum]
MSFRSLTSTLLAKKIGLSPIIKCARQFHFSGLSNSQHKRTVTLIPGDGVWPELFVCVKSVFKEFHVPVEFEEVSFGFNTSSDPNGGLNDAVNSVAKNKVGLKGIVRTPIEAQGSSALNLRMRRALDLYANVVHIRTLKGIPSFHQNLNLVIIREQLEGEYSSLEHESVKGVIESLKIITRYNSERIAKFAFDYAVRNKRRKVTAVHKANIMKLSDGLFLETCQNIAKLYPHIQFNSMIIDNCCMQLVSNPEQFDVMVMPNLYGNIVDNLAAGLVGGAGVVPGVSYSHEFAVFEPGTRHSFTSASGKDVANPTAILLSSSNLLRHINLESFANKIETAVLKVIKSKKSLTPDIGGGSSTTEFTEAVMEQAHSLKDH